MSIYTNTGLVKHAEAALKLKTKYMWGGILRLIEKQYNLLYTLYSKTSGTGYTPARWKELSTLFGKNYYGVDCVGLIKSYYWSGKPDGGTGSPGYCSEEYPDKSAADMYTLAKVKGKIKDLPEIPGLIVYDSRTHHVGIYIGSGYTIESTLGSRGDGVVKRKLDNLWTDWFQCPYIDYIKPATFAVNDLVCIKQNAVTYAGSTIKIPDKYKGSKNKYTIAKTSGKKALLKELYSWVAFDDLEKI